jgi:subtilisin family serine protease
MIQILVKRFHSRGGLVTAFMLAVLFSTTLHATDGIRQQTGTDAAVAKYGVSGAGVVVAILDRGIDYTHPDFIKPDGNTRIKYILDMTGPTSYYYCDDPARPISVEYTESQINTALHSGPPLPTRDAVGHGTVSAGVAAGNGRAFADGLYAGIAPEADLIIVKITSGADAHDNQPADPYFVGCMDEAFDWLNTKLVQLGEPPCVAILNLGVQYGPLDGTSVVSRQVEEIFGANRPGRIFAAGTGDEGGYPSHAGGDFTSAGPTIIRFTKPNSAQWSIAAWYTGTSPAEFTVRMDDGAVVGPVPPEEWRLNDGLYAFQNAPGDEPYPQTSDSGDRSVYMDIGAHTGGGQIEVLGIGPGIGRVDAYIVGGPPPMSFVDHLVPGRLGDPATTRGAVISAVYVSRTDWIDIQGNPNSYTIEGAVGELWHHSSDGPTRDDRLGVDVTTPGQGAFAAYAPNSVWRTCCPWNVIQDGGGWYGAHGAASASGPILVGATALMLEMCPTLTADQARAILHATATADANTGAVPNNQWGYGKLNMLAALDALNAARIGDFDCSGHVDIGDLPTFINVLLGLDANLLHVHRADINNDSTADGGDINGFVERLFIP